MQKLKEEIVELNRIISEAVQVISDSLRSCVKVNNANCVDCANEAVDRFSGSSGNLQSIQAGLLKKMMTAKSGDEGLNELKAKLKDLKFDLAGFGKGVPGRSPAIHQNP